MSGLTVQEGLSSGNGLSLSNGFSYGNGLSIQGPTLIGGLPIGYISTSGVTNGYQLYWGDDFDEAQPNVVGPANPYAKYTGVRASYATTGVHGLQVGVLNTFYDATPYDTGFYDANRGVAAAFPNMSQASSIITLQAVKASSAQQALNGGRPQIAAMLSFLPSVVWYTGANGIIVESYENRTTGAPAGYHPTRWSMSAETGAQDSTAQNTQDEWDYAEGTSAKSELNYNAHAASNTSHTYANYNDQDGAWHTQIAVLKGQGADPTGTVLTYTDGVVHANTKPSNVVPNLSSKSAFLLQTSHIYHGTFNTETYSLAAWNASATGGSIQIDYVRIWALPGTPYYKPLTSVADVTLGYLDATVITLPSQLTLWGSTGLTEVGQATAVSELDPGCTAWSSYSGLPSTVVWDANARTFTIDFSSDPTGNAGYLILTVHARQGGDTDSISVPLRIVVRRGPAVNFPATLYPSGGHSYTYDAYYFCTAGFILPKTVTVTGLPANMTYNSGTGLISGTSGVANGNYTAAVTVTNAYGQTASKNVPITVSTVPWNSTSSLRGWFDISVARPAVTNGLVSSWTNISGQGDLTTVVGGVTREPGQNQPFYALTFPPTDPVNPTAIVLYTQSTNLANTINSAAGADPNFTLIMVVNNNTGGSTYIGGWSEDHSATFDATAFIMRTGSASTARMVFNGVANDVTLGTISPNATHILAWRHTGGLTDLWVDSTTPISTGTSQVQAGTFGATPFFSLGTIRAGGSAWSTSTCGGLIYAVLAFNASISQASIEAYMVQLGLQYGVNTA